MSGKFMVLDTETTGLFDFKLAADDPTQPRMATAAIILLDTIDAEPREFGFMVKPDGWEMPADAGGGRRWRDSPRTVTRQGCLLGVPHRLRIAHMKSPTP